MFKISFYFLSAVCAFCVAMGGSMIDEGLWRVLSVRECDNADYKETIKLVIEKSKLNRTCDKYTAALNFLEDMDDSWALKVLICIHVDGGCKEYQVISENSAVNFLIKIAENNVREALKLCGVESGDFPVKKGEYDCEDYLIDYCEFPCKSVLGIFDAEVLLLDSMGQVHACILATVEFREPADDEELCEKCQEDK